MIVCSCTRITSGDISRAVAWMRSSDPTVLITPGKVYRSLGKRPVCGGCLRLFVQHLHEPEDNPLPSALRGLRALLEGGHDEGRREGHRISERRASQRADGGEPVLAALPAAE